MENVFLKEKCYRYDILKSKNSAVIIMFNVDRYIHLFSPIFEEVNKQ
jgi:hypothetical protein